MAAKAKKPAKKAKKAALKIPAELAALVPKAKAAKFDWNAFIQIIIALFNRQPPAPPPPAPVPTPTPVPPTPVPTPVPPVPEPHPMPAPPSGCSRPDAVKLGFRDQRKLARGYRIMFDASDMANGVKIPEGCGDWLNQQFGQMEAYQNGPGFTHDPVERSSSNPSLLVIATNNDADWDGNRYKLAGNYEVGVSRSVLNVWRAQKFTIDDQGQAHGMGNNQQSFDVPK
jgi:hypothetical protein